MKKVSGTAAAKIKFGDLVLCRDFRIAPAPPELANATADPLPNWDNRKHYKKGDRLTATLIEGLGQRDLKVMAAGPIMEPLKLFLPAGKLTEAEYQARLDLDFRQAGIDRDEVVSLRR